MTDKQNLLKVIGILYCARLPVTSTVMILITYLFYFKFARFCFEFMACFNTVGYCCSSTGKEKADLEASRFLRMLTNVDNLKLMCFLADLLFILQNFQKRLQSDTITIVDIQPQLEIFKKKLLTLQTACLPGGWEEALQRDITNNNGKEFLFGTELWMKDRRLPASNRYVTDKRMFSAIRNDSVQALINFMSERLQGV